MKTPRFFYQKSLIAFFLIPFSIFFFIATKIRKIFIKPIKLKNKFVICVGNASSGGGGKTPSAILIAEILQNKGFSVCFLSKGYGRKTKGFYKATKEMKPEETGDEPRILMQTATVFLFSKYKEIVRNLFKIKEEIIIMDDGFQNPSIIKDFSILVIDGKLKFGNGFLLPAGPLREFPKEAFSKANAVFLIDLQKNSSIKIPSNIASFNITKKYNLLNAGKSEAFLAFCGLAVNEKFFSSLKKLQLNAVEKLEFEDHHTYSTNEIISIIEASKKKNLKPITTEKDFVKIPPEFSKYFAVLGLKFKMQKEAEFLHMLKLNGSKGGI